MNILKVFQKKNFQIPRIDLLKIKSMLLQTIDTKTMEKKYFAHETAIIDDGAEIGDGTKIWHFCHIMSGSLIGSNCNLGQNVVVSPDVKLGSNVKIQITPV